jgi:hypothetical protein
VTILQPYFSPDGLVSKCLEYCTGLEHVMDFTRLRALGSLFSMLNQIVRNVLTYNQNHMDFPMQVCMIFVHIWFLEMFIQWSPSESPPLYKYHPSTNTIPLQIPSLYKACFFVALVNIIYQ